MCNSHPSCTHSSISMSICSTGYTWDIPFFYIQVFILKDCLCVRLNLLEIRRLNNCVPGLTSSSSNFQHYQYIQKSFVKDACKFCDLTHLMSFMYDVYVKMIAKSISCSRLIFLEERNYLRFPFKIPRKTRNHLTLFHFCVIWSRYTTSLHSMRPAICIWCHFRSPMTS